MARKKNNKSNTNYKMDFKDNSIVNVKWSSPNDKKANNLRIVANFKDANFVRVRDYH